MTGELEFSDDFQRAISLIEEGSPFIFVTGKAGTGKSTLIQHLMRTTRRRFAVVAPTGVAALNAGGQTIHSFFRIRPGPIDPDEIQRVKRRKVFENLEVLFIDEISMVRADLLDGVEKFLRLNGPEPGRPFGGVQIVSFGDLYQLPPVISDPQELPLFSDLYRTEYFFSAHGLRSTGIAGIELQKTYRQSDPSFVHLLNQIRTAQNVDEAVDRLNELCCRPADGPALVLSATNAVADQINARENERLPGDGFLYHGVIDGQFDFHRSLPAPMELLLKVGTQVMFTRNDIQKRWVNGTLGVVKALDPDFVEVEITDGGRAERVDVQPALWESIRYTYDEVRQRIRGEVVGSYAQLPLVAAWAMTIHKSQGKTLQRVILDLGSGAFANGQVYVALSRCRSVSDITLRRPLKRSDVLCDPRVNEFCSTLGLSPSSR